MTGWGPAATIPITDHVGLRQETKNPGMTSGALLWLRDKHRDTNSLILEIPIIFMNSHKSAKHIIIDRDRLPYYLNLKSVDLIPLSEAGLIGPKAPVRIPRPSINYAMLAQEYRQRLENGECSTRAELARNLGVSRAWIWKVMKRGPTTDTTFS